MKSKQRVIVLLTLSVLCAVVLAFAYGGITLAQGGVSPTPQKVAPVQGSYTVYLPLVFKSTAPPPVPFADEMIGLVNQERAKNGCPALAKNTALTNAAQGHSTNMALNDFFDHRGLDGSWPWDRASRAGYNWSSIGENIAAGYSTPTSAMQAWMNSAGHRANILNCNYRDIGVGYYYLANDPGSVTYRHYWTQVFGTPR
jgi:uncharacterized protein YkwD